MKVSTLAIRAGEPEAKGGSCPVLGKAVALQPDESSEEANRQTWSQLLSYFGCKITSEKPKIATPRLLSVVRTKKRLLWSSLVVCLGAGLSPERA